jgi:hypothetical protein
VQQQVQYVFNKSWIYSYLFSTLIFQYMVICIYEKPNFIFLYMSWFAGLLLMSRLFFVKDDELCDTNNEPLCGEKTCSFSGNKHIAWHIRLRAPGKHAVNSETWATVNAQYPNASL